MQSTQCLECKYYLGALTCEAFPDGIPEVIVTGQFDHANHFAGDHGIRFSPLHEESHVAE